MALYLLLSYTDNHKFHPVSIPLVSFPGYWKIFSLDKARAVLGYQPQDDAGPVLDPDAKQLERDFTEFKVHPE